MQPQYYARALFESLERTQDESERDRRVANFFSLLKRNGRMRLLPRILEALEAVIRNDEAERTVEVATARAVNDEERRKIMSTEAVRRFLKDERRIIRFKEDLTLVGGFTAQSRGELYDASYRRQLLELYARFTQMI